MDSPDDEDALGQLPRPLPEGVGLMVAVKGSMLKTEHDADAR